MRDLHNCTQYTHCVSWASIQQSVVFPQSPQLNLPEGTQPRCGHTITPCRMGESRVHVTTFGGCPLYDLEVSDDALPKLADTTVLEFGELRV